MLKFSYAAIAIHNYTHLINNNKQKKESKVTTREGNLNPKCFLKKYQVFWATSFLDNT